MIPSNRPFSFKAADLVLVGGLLAVAAGLIFALWLWAGDGQTVEVQVDGMTVAALPLDTDTALVIDGVGGGQNTLVIADGKASVTEATCPDGVCVRHRAIDRAGQSIICLPHKVVVRIAGEAAVDAEAG